MSRAARRLGLRGRLLLSVIGAIAVVLAALVLAFNLVLSARLNRQADDAARARAAAEVATLQVSGARIVLPEAPDAGNPDLLLWVFAGDRAIEAPRTGTANRRAAARLAGGGPTFADVAASDTRLYALPVGSARRAGTVVVGVGLAAYEQSRTTALVGSLILAVAVLVAVGLAASWLIDRALRPVARMTRQASEWSERDLDRRFAPGPADDELALLARTLNGLLERLAGSLRHEQRLSAEISHELRTPLAKIVAEAQLARRRGDGDPEHELALERILDGAHQLTRTLDALMAAARAQFDPHRATSDAFASAQAAARAGADAPRAGELRIRVAPPAAPIRVAVEPELVERVLAPLLENAARHAAGAVTVSITREASEVSFAIEDDGPGVPAEEREAIFLPGHRAAADQGVATLAGAGLGLALCRRLARGAGGGVEVEDSSAGARFVVRLPAA